MNFVIKELFKMLVTFYNNKCGCIINLDLKQP